MAKTSPSSIAAPYQRQRSASLTELDFNEVDTDEWKRRKRLVDQTKLSFFWLFELTLFACLPIWLDFGTAGFAFCGMSLFYVTLVCISEQDTEFVHMIVQSVWSKIHSAT